MKQKSTKKTKQITTQKEQDLIDAGICPDCGGKCEEYFDMDEPIAIGCNQCNMPFLATPNNHLSGQGCPICSPQWYEQKRAELIKGKN